MIPTEKLAELRAEAIEWGRIGELKALKLIDVVEAAIDENAAWRNMFETLRSQGIDIWTHRNNERVRLTLEETLPVRPLKTLMPATDAAIARLGGER